MGHGPGGTRRQALAALAQRRPAGLAGVLTDIDDSRTRDGEIDPPARATLAALQRLAAAAVPEGAITGRPAGWSKPARWLKSAR